MRSAGAVSSLRPQRVHQPKRKNSVMGLEMSNWVQKSELMQGLAGSKSSKICVLCLKCKDELRKTHFFHSSPLGYGPKPAIAQCSLSVSTYVYFHTPGLHTEHWFLRAASIDVVGEKLNSPKSVWLVSLAPSSWCIAALSLCAAFWCGMLEKKLLDDLPEVFDSTRSCMTFHAPPSRAAGSLGSQNCVWSCVFFSPAVQEFHFFGT